MRYINGLSINQQILNIGATITHNFDYFENQFINLNDNLSISFSNHSNQINNLNISTNLLDIKLNNYGISQNNINADLQNSKNLIAISSTNIQVENQLQQNQINSLIIQGVSGQVIDTVFGISASIFDSKIGILTGISLPTFGISSNNLNIKTEIIIQT